MSTRNRCCDSLSTNRASQPLGPEDRLPSFLTRCSSSCQHICSSPLHTSDAPSRGPSSCWLFRGLLALGLALLEVGTLLGRHGSDDITAVHLLLVLRSAI